MATLVVTTQGAYVRCAGGQIVVEKERMVIHRLPLNQVERVLLLGGIGLSTGFLQFALSQRIPVTFLSQDGQYKGRLDPGGRRDVTLRLAQVKRLEDLSWRCAISAAIVRAKIAGQRSLLQRRCRNRPQPELQAAAQVLKEIAEQVSDSLSLPRLMGLEGQAARAYFRVLPLTLRHALPFHGRSRRPPKDPVNALLSLGYGLLTAEILGALTGVGLDPQIGIFHSTRGRMPALAEDLLELFRAPVADALALSLVNLEILRENDFTKTEEGGVNLSKPALEVYFRQYRRRMQASFRDRKGEVTSFRRALQAQAGHLRRVILHKEAYEPFIPPLGGPDRDFCRRPIRANLPSGQKQQRSG